MDSGTIKKATAPTVTMMKVSELVPYLNNPRINDKAVDKVAASIEEFGFKVPIIVDKQKVIVAGHTRLRAAKKLGLKEVPVIVAEDLTDEQVKAFRLADNKTAEFSEWNEDLLINELLELQTSEFEMIRFGFDEIEEDAEEDLEVEEDDFDAEPPTEAKSRPGDIYKLGSHRLMCGDSTSREDIELLMDGHKADLCLTDPPYGMKKEGDGVLNDNMNFDDLLEFNKKWIPLSFEALTEVGSWYCFGIDEPLMDIYSEILKPAKKRNELTFRNLLTWDKGSGLGQMSGDFRKYSMADEKILFVMKGVQGFNTNADNYYEGWEPIRKYLADQKELMGWNDQDITRITGATTVARHCFGRSQWEFPTQENYNKMREAAQKKAFKREYDALKREYYSTRAFFDNTHDNMNNVWHFSATSQEERKEAGGHATPKPLAVCARAIKSSCPEGGAVLDLFGGSGSTLIACEQLMRKCFMMELAPEWVDVIIARWEKLTGQKAELISRKEEKE